jgi:hypothetical protein
MDLRWCQVAGTFLLALGGVSCRVLPSFSPVAIEEQCSSGQLVFHSDFPLPMSHRLVRDLVAERSDINELLLLPMTDEPIHVHLFRDGQTYAEYVVDRFPDVPDRRAFFVESDTRLMVYAHWSGHVAEDLRHEVAHGYLHAALGGLPLWLDEGLAEYFEVPRGQHGFNEPHVDSLVGLIADEKWHPDLQRLAAIEQFSALTQRDYAEAWAWVHFLLRTTPQHRELLQTYLRELQRDGFAEPLWRRITKIHIEPDRNLAEHLLELRRGT